MPVHYDRVFFLRGIFFHYYFLRLPPRRVFVPPHLTFVCQTSGAAPRQDRRSVQNNFGRDICRDFSRFRRACYLNGNCYARAKNEMYQYEEKNTYGVGENVCLIQYNSVGACTGLLTDYCRNCFSEMRLFTIIYRTNIEY